MLATLTDIMGLIKNKHCAIPAFNVFGYEDAVAVIRAAEELDAPVILATNKVAIKHMPIQHIGALLKSLANAAKVPVCIHLDHGANFEVVAEAILNGYTSVMYDGSQLPLDENIKNTREIVKLAHACGVPCEAEIGSVGYNDPNMEIKSFFTEPGEAKEFVMATNVDALAVAVGSLHRMEDQSAVIQFDRLQKIQDVVDTPLVIHGSSGIKDADLQKLITYNVMKVNVGTALRMAFGHTLRDEMQRQPQEYDRIVLFQKSMESVKQEAIKKMKILGL